MDSHRPCIPQLKHYALIARLEQIKIYTHLLQVLLFLNFLNVLLNSRNINSQPSNTAALLCPIIGAQVGSTEEPAAHWEGAPQHCSSHRQPGHSPTSAGWSPQRTMPASGDTPGMQVQLSHQPCTCFSSRRSTTEIVLGGYQRTLIPAMADNTKSSIMSMEEHSCTK